MNLHLRIATLACASASLFFFTPKAQADPWDKKTVVNFPESVEFPGRVVVPSGQYVMKLVDSTSNRHIVQVFNNRENKVFATILAIPTERQKPADKTVITFYETPKDQPMVIRKWYYPGETVGQEFVYPRERALYIARTSHTSVPAMNDKGTVASARVTPEMAAPEEFPETGEVAETTVAAAAVSDQQSDNALSMADDEGMPVEQAAPAETPAAYDDGDAVANDAVQSDQPDQQPRQTASATSNSSLPATAGTTPYLVLLGSLLGSSGLVVRRFRLWRDRQ